MVRTAFGTILFKGCHGVTLICTYQKEIKVKLREKFLEKKKKKNEKVCMAGSLHGSTSRELNLMAEDVLTCKHIFVLYLSSIAASISFGRRIKSRLCQSNSL